MPDAVYFDSCVFIALLKAEEGRIDDIKALFDLASMGSLNIVTSTLTITEVLHIGEYSTRIPKEDRDKVKALFANDYIVFQTVTKHIADFAQEFVWEYDIRPKDSIHIATAIANKIPILYSYDSKLIAISGVNTPHGSITIATP